MKIIMRYSPVLFFSSLMSSKSFSQAVIVWLFSDYEAIVKLSDGFNGADLRNVCTEAGGTPNVHSLLSLASFSQSTLSVISWFVLCLLAGLFAIRSDREYVTQEDFMKAVRKVADSKKLESKLDYKPV